MKLTKCYHKNTEIWEPHLAGARKCMDCGRINNPNLGVKWFYEKRKPKEFDFTLGFIIGCFAGSIITLVTIVTAGPIQ